VAGKVFLVLAGIVGLAIAALLIGFSGFVFGGGRESYHGGMVFMGACITAVIACIIAPATGFILNAAAKPGLAQVVA
jgi:hypothetical protein